MFLSRLAAPLAPPIETIRHYNTHKLRKDLIAGLTVSVVEVPQAMAYAIIAGVPPVYGLYTSILQGLLGALLSSSEHMTTGPTNTQSLLIASAIRGIALPHSDPAVYLQLVFSLTLLKGLLQLTFAAARLGDLVRYISRSVIVGLVAGAGVLILIGQLPNFLGIDISHEQSRLPGILSKMEPLTRLERTVRLIGESNWRAVALGAGVVAVIVGMRLVSRFLPGALTGVILSAAAVGLLGWHGPQGAGQAALPLIAEIPRGLPHPVNPWPGLQYANELLTGALALAVLGMLESVAIAKSIAAKSGERVSANQEFFAQGMTNSITSFFQCIPGSGSFTRSALDYEAGAQTRLAAVFNALFVGAIFLLLADWARLIPMASLAAVLFVIAAGLIDWRYIARVARTNRSDALVCLATFAATLLAPLEYAIFIGILLNIGVYLRTASRLHVAEMVQLGEGRFIERPIHDRTGERQVIFVQLEGELFFAIADELQDLFTRLTRSGARVVILRLKRTHSIDATVLHVFEGFARDMWKMNRHVVLCGVKPELMTRLKRFGLIDSLGRENVFETDTGVFTSAKRAMQRARQLVGASIDTSGINVDESEAWAYSI